MLEEQERGGRRYRCALITGASSGLGKEYARQLAEMCDAMVLVARRGELLHKLAEDLRLSFLHLQVHCFVVDLSDELEREALYGKVEQEELEVDLLVNNAGLGDYGDFAGASWRKLDMTLQVNVTALTHLTHLFLPKMLASGRGALVNVSSLASVVPIPDFSVYAASKAYVTSFSEALRMELRGYGIPVLAVCPGPVHTGFGDVAMERGRSGVPSRDGFYTEAELVVGESIRALLADRARVYPGWKVALVAAGVALLPMVCLRLIQERRREGAMGESVDSAGEAGLAEVEAGGSGVRLVDEVIELLVDER